MSGAAKRPYHSPLRAELAERTRRQIREAAAELFVGQGYVATTVKQIAAAAGVAPRTVFAAFPGGKAEVFHAALDVATAGDELPVPVVDRADFQAALADPDTTLDRLADSTTRLLERAGRLIMATVESAGADPDMRRLADLGAGAMAGNMRAIAQALHEAGRLRAGLPVGQAADILFALASPHVHSLLRHQRGWPAEQYRQWLRTTLTRTLLRDPAD